MGSKADFRHIVAAATNEKPVRLPLYEHNISPRFMEQAMNVQFADMINGDSRDIKRFFECFCEFFNIMSYDTVSFEVCITEMLPGHGALFGGKPGRIGLSVL